MVPDKFNMVDMGGIDLIMMQGEAVPGLYEKLVAAVSNCRYQCLYNWMFDGVLIPPVYVQLTDNDGEVYLNEGVSVTSDDVIHIYSVEPGPVDPEIIPLLAEENGVYNVPAGKDGFNPVTVDVPSYTPVISSLTVTENGTYTAPSGTDGYSPVIVNVPAESSFVTPDYQGLAYSYIANNGGYYSNTVRGTYTSYFHVSAGRSYCIFVGSATGNRNRCHFYANKTIADFDEYINNSIENALIFNCTNNISGATDLDSNIRFVFTPSADGEIVFVTSNLSEIVPGYCVELP